jgi:hypothetical protein
VGLSVAACSDVTPPDPDEDRIDAGEVTVTRAEPTVLPLASTFTLRVFGSGFTPTSRVVLTVEGESTPKVRTVATLFVSPQELDATITTAADAPGGPYDVVVEGRNGKQGVGTELVDLQLRVLGIHPESTEPGEDVMISGSGFGGDRFRLAVTVDGIQAVVRSASRSLIVAQVPFNTKPGTVEVRVSLSGAAHAGTVSLNVKLGDPVIDGFSPSAADPGDTLEIIGRNFGSQQDQVTVTFGSLPARVLLALYLRTKVIVPSAIQPGDALVVVSVGDLSSRPMPFPVSPPSPSISAVGPSVTLPGSDIVVFGSHFGSDPGRVSVEFCSTVRVRSFGYSYYGYGYGYDYEDHVECHPASFSDLSDTRVTVHVPGGLPPGNSVLSITVRDTREPASTTVQIL